jgi:hypothetical protein
MPGYAQSLSPIGGKESVFVYRPPSPSSIPLDEKLPRRVSAQAPPPMFSPWYAESLRGILTLEESGAARLEQNLAANPDDFPSLLKLLAY